jgi:DNA-binding HxlR family transcriptional regulator
LQAILDVRQITGGEWAWDVLLTLLQRPSQYGDLLATIQQTPVKNLWPGKNHRRLRDATLTRTLRRLEQSELVERVRDLEFPYHTTYHISEAARELSNSILPLVQWAEHHQDLIARAQHRRHEEQSDRN